MKNRNLHIWTRTTKFDLQHLSNSLGNAALKVIKFWAEDGEGRSIKASTERMTRMLEATHDSSGLDFHIDNLELVVNELKALPAKNFFKEHVAPQPYIDRKGNKSKFGDALADRIANFDNFVSVNRPARKLPDGVAPDEVVSHPTQLDPQEELMRALKALTPEQQPGPLQFEFHNGILRLRRQPAICAASDSNNIANARAALLTDVTSLQEALLETNCDPRLLSAVEEIRLVLASDADIIRIGLMGLTCDHLFARFSEQVSDVAVARFAGLSMGISLFVGQFPEWRQFTENAALTEYTSLDVRQTYEIGQNLLPKLRANELIDPEVPHSIELMFEALQNPTRSGQRALFGVVRSLENLFAKILSELAVTYAAVADGARSGLKKVATAAAAASLILLVVDGAIKLSPIAEKILKTSWLKTAADFMKEGLNNSD